MPPNHSLLRSLTKDIKLVSALPAEKITLCLAVLTFWLAPMHVDAASAECSTALATCTWPTRQRSLASTTSDQACSKCLDLCSAPLHGVRMGTDVNKDGIDSDGGEIFLSPVPGTSLGPRIMRFGPLERSLRETLNEKKLPTDIVAQVSDMFSRRKEIDLDAPPKPGDSYRVSYQTGGEGHSGQQVRLLAIALRMQGRLYTAEFFKPSNESSGAYFSFDGRPLSTAPFLMPVSNATVTSPFGIRLHPVKGVMLEHTGVDLGARLGAPVKAAAEGTVEVVGYDKRGYGRYVVIHHNSDYSTWYAHLSSIAKGVRVGARLLASQVLGAVGRTGDATGPHLHFEVRYRDRPTDPMLVTATHQSPQLTDIDDAAFNRQTAALLKTIALYTDRSMVSTSASVVRLGNPSGVHDEKALVC
jgi:murein DD-endopeptidase MepM/ murein hydrolase activator NlpD